MSIVEHRAMRLEVGGRGKIISDFGFRIANLKARCQEKKAWSKWRAAPLEVGGRDTRKMVTGR